MSTHIKHMQLEEGEHIVTAWAEHASGPGWANRPLWVIISDGNGKLRRDCAQPEEHTPQMREVFNISATVAAQMTAYARSAFTPPCGEKSLARSMCRPITPDRRR